MTERRWHPRAATQSIEFVKSRKILEIVDRFVKRRRGGGHVKALLHRMCGAWCSNPETNTEIQRRLNRDEASASDSLIVKEVGCRVVLVA